MNDISTSSLVKDYVSQLADGVIITPETIPALQREKDRWAAAHAFLRRCAKAGLVQINGASMETRSYTVLSAKGVADVVVHDNRGRGSILGRENKKDKSRSLSHMLMELSTLVVEIRAEVDKLSEPFAHVTTKALAEELAKRLNK